MNRVVLALGLCIAVAGCSAAASSPQPSPSAGLPTQPAASATLGSTATKSPAATEALEPAGIVAYDVCTNLEPRSACRIWAVTADGTSIRQLVPPDRDPEKRRYPGVPDSQFPLAWSPDGSRLYFRFERTEPQTPTDTRGELHTGLAVTDASGSVPVELIDVVRPFRSSDPWCPAAVLDDNCQANVDEAAISPDGARLAYPILEGRDLNVGTIVLLEVASGQMTRLESTRAENPGSGPNETLIEEPCATKNSQGDNESLSWSPDGSRLLFGRQAIGPRVNGYCQSTILTVNADGSDLRRLVPAAVPALVPHWSPDGSTILFHTASPASTSVDVYTVRADGSGLRALTSDGSSIWPQWTVDRRIVFISDPDRGSLSIMDADGSNASPLDATIPALTAAGCVVCPYPDDQGQFWNGQGLNIRMWQPTPAGRP